MLLVLTSVAGVLALWRLAHGRSVLPERRRPRRSGPRAGQRTVLLAVGAAVLGVMVTRSPIVAVIAGGVVVLWPRIVGGAAAEKATVAKVEALAMWTEMLRDLSSSTSGLEEAIPRTVATAPPELATPLKTLNHLLAMRMPLPEALSRFAGEVDDAGADMIVAALSLNARLQGGGLTRILTTLAASMRAELDMRTKVMRERNGIRREAAQVAVLTTLLVVGTAVLQPQWVQAYQTAQGQVILLGLAAGYLGLFMRIRKLATPEPEERFLANSDTVLEAASYLPRRGVNR